MSTSRDSQETGTSKLKRSRNGCNECRRLHRRCDEEKPACLNCREAGKACSYQRPLSWGGRPFRKSTFGHALESGVVEIPIADSEDDAPYSRSFVYGQAESSGSTTSSGRGVKQEPRSRSVRSTRLIQPDESSLASRLEGTVIQTMIPWLSNHHQKLVHHFVDTTIKLFAEIHTVQEDLRSVILPMAVDTNHGFSLLAAILSLASTHRVNLELHRNVSEMEYWRDMSVGHLRRPTVQEDESTQDVFAATALVLCVQDIISNVEKPFSWKLHLQGAFTVITGSEHQSSTAPTRTRRTLKRTARSLQVRSLLPTCHSQPCPGDVDRKQLGTQEEILGFPNDLSSILLEIRSLRLEKNALQNIETNSGGSNMQPLWGVVRGRCLELIVNLRNFSDNATSHTDDSSITNQLYGFVALVQIYFGVLDLPTTDSGLRNTLGAAMDTLRKLLLERDEHLVAHLVFPLFTIGCVIRAAEDRILIGDALGKIAKLHGKGNASLANSFLEDLWENIDVQDRPVKQADIDELMAVKGWDLSLW